MRKLCHFLHALRRDENGNVFILTGLAILFLMAVGGAGVDFGRQQAVKIKLQQASDAAALAAATMPLGTDEQDRIDTAERYFRLNFPEEYIGIERPGDINVDIGADSVTVSAGSQIPAKFIRNVGVLELSATGASTVQLSATATQAYDVILVMDNSGSMDRAAGSASATRESPAGQARNDARTAGRDNCNCTYSNDELGLVGNNRLNALRSAAYTLADHLLEPNTTGSRVGLVTWNGALIAEQALTPDFTTVRDRIDRMFAYGSTNSYIGMQRAQTLGAAFDDTHVQAIVYLTDGKNTVSGPTFGFPPTDSNGCNGRCENPPGPQDFRCNGQLYCEATNTLTEDICDDLKSQGILIYTIGFGADVADGGADSAFAQPFLSRCASGLPATNRDQYFFIAPDGDALEAAFNEILNAIRDVRIIN